MRFLEILSFFSFSFHFVGTKPTGNGSLRSESVDDECRCCEGFLSLSSFSFLFSLSEFFFLALRKKEKKNQKKSQQSDLYSQNERSQIDVGLLA